MKKVLYIFLSVLVIVAVSSCGKETILQEQPMEKEIVRVSIQPVFDDLEIEVKSLEIGKTDILCYAYSSAGLLAGYPIKQTEINGNTYLYDIPRDGYYLAFMVYPGDVEFHYTYYDDYIKDTYVYYDDPSYSYKTTLVHKYSEVTCEKKYYYLGNQKVWWGHLNYYNIDDDCSFGTVTLSNMQRDCKLMFNFTGMPEGETAETYVDKIHVKVGGMSLDKVLTMEDLASETVEEETLWCKTIYTVMGYDLFGEGFRTMDIIIECTDGKIFVVDQFKYNYIRNEQQRININFSTQE